VINGSSVSCVSSLLLNFSIFIEIKFCSAISLLVFINYNLSISVISNFFMNRVFFEYTFWVITIFLNTEISVSLSVFEKTLLDIIWPLWFLNQSAKTLWFFRFFAHHSNVSEFSCNV
jgi:hypothetical protein